MMRQQSPPFQGTGSPPNTKQEKRCCRAGVCRCWYCCCAHCCVLPLFWLYGVVIFGQALYYALKYTLELDSAKQRFDLHFLYWGTMTYAFLFVMLVQLAYLLVLFESVNKCGRCTFAFLYVFTFLICLLVFVLSIYCRAFCPNGKHVKDTKTLNSSWQVRILQQNSQIRYASGITMGLMVFLLHIYLHNVLQFVEEFDLRHNKNAYCGDRSFKIMEATLPLPSGSDWQPFKMNVVNNYQQSSRNLSINNNHLPQHVHYSSNYLPPPSAMKYPYTQSGYRSVEISPLTRNFNSRSNYYSFYGNCNC